MSVLERNAVTVTGQGDKPLIFLHGYACDQTMWRYIAPKFEADRRVVLYDHTGSGRSDLKAYDKHKYAGLNGFADDLIEICEALHLTGADVVGHSVGGMIALLAAKKRPDLFDRVMLLGASACYLNLPPEYLGGFDRAGVDELLAFLEINLEAWSAHLAPMVMANAERPELTDELQSYFVRNDPDIAHHFAKVIFLSDHRAEVAGIAARSLVIQCNDDIIAPATAGAFLHAVLPQSDLVVLDTQGHYPHLSAPAKVTETLSAWLGTSRALAA